MSYDTSEKKGLVIQKVSYDTICEKILLLTLSKFCVYRDVFLSEGDDADVAYQSTISARKF